MLLNPLILTLTLDEESQAYFTALRDTYFPAERNYLKAHLTLFHKLPQGEASLQETLTNICLAHTPMELEVVGPKSIGNGVAYFIRSEALQGLHKQLQRQWKELLSPQDHQPLRPHITIQNKVAPATAKALQEQLAVSFLPFTIMGTGLTLWEYKGGPWEFYRSFPFQAACAHS